jgi:photosystem II stability/assembly factor-like uncharacterized protein
VRARSVVIPSIALVAVAAAATAAAPTGLVDNVAAGLTWRLLGPHRGGWSTVAVGVPGAPDTFYFGAAGGGVWKTTSAGRTWTPVFDGGPPSIGAIAVAPSDPKTIYVGTGQVTSRYDVAAGEGMFKSVDAGSTWAPIGLAATRHIGAILVDPRNAKVVIVAAFGHVFGPNPERGVYRSDDGGSTWTRTLFVDDTTGAIDLACDPAAPEVVFASVWHFRERPWMTYYDSGDSEQSGVWKSTDGGKTWTRVEGGGWPNGKLGRIGVAAVHAGETTRVYAVVESGESGGLYRSDDRGATWTRVNAERGLGSDYFGHVRVLPGDPDTVFVTGRSLRRCTGGGAQCEVFKGSPGGDDYHDLWIDPEHPSRMITASDQGTVVTVDKGATWSSWYNQPTAQLYHLAADDRFPYRVYSGQQDSGSVSIASRSDYGAVTFRDWHPVGADERDFDLPDPSDQDVVYGSGLGGRLSRWDGKNGEVQNVSPWPLSSYGARPTTVKYHYGWFTPIAVSKVAPYPLYQGAQVLFRSLDRGASWTAITSDATARGEAAKACLGDPTPEQARTCGYGVIASIGLSPRDNDTIWIGTEDGRVRLTRDAGKLWADVTPKQVPAWAKIASIDVPGIDAGSAYVAVDSHRQDDFTPMAFRTHDFGKTWTAIGAGLPKGQYVGVLRADTEARGLLFAGTDHGVFVSADDGATFRPLGRGMPVAVVTDLLVHDGDLIAATQGRALWVLGDVSPLRSASAAAPADRARLFPPAPATRLRRNQSKDTPLPPEEPAGKNPPAGAVIDYWIPAGSSGAVVLTILDTTGTSVRKIASDEAAAKLGGDRYFAESWTRPRPGLSAEAGFHRFVWDLRGERPKVPRYEYSIAAVDGEDTPQLPEGMLVPPGAYRVELTVGSQTLTQPLAVVADPRVPIDAAALDGALALSKEVVAALTRHTALAKGAERPRGPRHDEIGDGLLSLQIDLEGSDRAPTVSQREAFRELKEKLDEEESAATRK